MTNDLRDYPKNNRTESRDRIMLRLFQLGRVVDS
jgi:hypothetical protein